MSGSMAQALAHNFLKCYPFMPGGLLFLFSRLLLGVHSKALRVRRDDLYQRSEAGVHRRAHEP